MKKIIFLIAFIFSGIAILYAQDDKAQMEKERQDIQQELADLQKNYNQIKGKRSVTLGQLNVLKRKIEVQERYLNNINRETYRSYREQQVNSILETQEQIEKRKRVQISQMGEKKLAIQNQAKQVEVLQSQKKEKDETVHELKSKEKELKHQIASKQKRDRDLKNAILAIVRREVKKAEDEAKKTKINTNSTNTNVTNINPNIKTATPAVKPKSYFDLNAEDVKLNSSFENNRGKLPWPVDNGVVSIHFGPYLVEGTPIKGVNPGITIATASTGMAVKSVFSGEVVGVFNLGDGMAVTIRHGKYFTTYSNLAGVNVSKGSPVTTGQPIGTVGQSDDGSGGQIDFILMIESKNVNPEPWLRRR